MPVVIREIVTEVALSASSQERPDATTPGSAQQLSEEELDRVVRRCSERVLETLRREWER